MNPPYLSAIINGHYKTKTTEAILDKIEEIIKPYEKQKPVAGSKGAISNHTL